jgi:hypothetical protein
LALAKGVGLHSQPPASVGDVPMASPRIAQPNPNQSVCWHCPKSRRAVGLDWQLGGFAVGPPTASMGDSNQAAQLVQAMAGFGGGSGAGGSLNTVPLSAETSQQELLMTTPQHA